MGAEIKDSQFFLELDVNKRRKAKYWKKKETIKSLTYFFVKRALIIQKERSQLKRVSENT